MRNRKYQRYDSTLSVQEKLSEIWIYIQVEISLFET
jgi:hypothetical protein